MWMNLHTLPEGKSMYTLYLTWDEVGTPAARLCIEEVDTVLDAGIGALEVARAAKAEIDGGYAPGYRVIGVGDESTGDMLWQSTQGDLLAE